MVFICLFWMSKVKLVYILLPSRLYSSSSLCVRESMSWKQTMVAEFFRTNEWKETGLVCYCRRLVIQHMTV